MEVLEIIAGIATPSSPAPHLPVARISPAALGLSATPQFLAAAVNEGGTLWDQLRLSWTDPGVCRDLLGR